jgi:ABC-type sugar transport system substrate-binding protein
VDGILLHSTDEKVIDQMVEEAHRAGIPISTFYIPTASRSVPHLQINEAKTSFEMGAAAAEKWTEWYPDIPIKIGVIDFLTIPIVQEHRTGPFIEGVMSVAPDAEVVSKLEGGGNIQKAMETMQDMLQAHPEVNVVYGANADHALGALAALKNAGRGTAVDGKVDTEIVVGTDATEAELLEVFDPSSALKITQGLQPAINAQAEADLIMQIINGEVPFDEWLNVDTFDKFISFYDTPIDEATEFLSYQYFSEVDLEEAISNK